MKKIGLRFFVGLAMMTGIWATVNPVNSKASTETDFINSIKKPVISVSHKNHLYASVMMAQAILESDWGQSGLAVSGNNYFGIKGSYHGNSVTMSTAEYSTKGNKYTTNANFKKYPNVTASIEDNAKLLRNGTDEDPDYYSGTWTENTIDYRDAAATLSSTYATDMEYGNKLTKVIQKYHLTKLDTSTSSMDIEKQIAASVKDNMKTTKKKTTRKVVKARVKTPHVDLSKIDKSKAMFQADTKVKKVKPMVSTIKLV